MDTQTSFQVIEAVAIVIGIVFAMVQVSDSKRDKRRQAAFELLHSFQTPDFASAVTLVYSMPDGLNKQEIEEFAGDQFHLFYAMATTWESLGILVHRGEVDIEMVEDFFSGPILVSWRKLEGHVMGERSDVGRETIFEWFQWLRDRMTDRESNTPAVPAHIQYRDWQP